MESFRLCTFHCICQALTVTSFHQTESKVCDNSEQQWHDKGEHKDSDRHLRTVRPHWMCSHKGVDQLYGANSFMREHPLYHLFVPPLDDVYIKPLQTIMVLSLLGCLVRTS